MKFSDFEKKITDPQIDSMEAWLNDETTTEDEVFNFVDLLPDVELVISSDFKVVVESNQNRTNLR